MKLIILFLLTLSGLAFIVASLLAFNVLPGQLLVGQFEIELASVIYFVGLVLAICMALLVLAFRWWDRRLRQVRAAGQRATADKHRRFLQRFDHELKNPLTIIRLGIANLQQEENLRDEQLVSLERMNSQAQRIQKLIQDLRWLGELETRGLDRYPVDLSDVLDEVVQLVREERLPNGKAIDLSLQEVPWRLGQVQGDRELLVLAFRNLVDNAVKFTTEDGKIVVRASDDGTVAVVEVADTGTGIAANDILHVFEDLYRAENALGTAGSGLGLAMVERIIAVHEGEIKVRSREGQGTVVTVRLPLAIA